MKLTHETLVRANPAQILLPRFTVSQIMRNDQQVSFRIFFTANYQMFDRNDYIVVKYAKVDSSGQPDHDADGNIIFYKPPKPPQIPPSNKDKIIFGKLKKAPNGSYDIDWGKYQVSEVPSQRQLASCEALPSVSSVSLDTSVSGASNRGWASGREASVFHSSTPATRTSMSLTPSEAAEMQATLVNVGVGSPKSFTDKEVQAVILPHYDSYLDTPYTPLDQDDSRVQEAAADIAEASSVMSVRVPSEEAHAELEKKNDENSNKKLYQAVSNTPDTPLPSKIPSQRAQSITQELAPLSYEITTTGQTVAVTEKGNELRAPPLPKFSEEEKTEITQSFAEAYSMSVATPMFNVESGQKDQSDNIQDNEDANSEESTETSSGSPSTDIDDSDDPNYMPSKPNNPSSSTTGGGTTAGTGTDKPQTEPPTSEIEPPPPSIDSNATTDPPTEDGKVDIIKPPKDPEITDDSEDPDYEPSKPDNSGSDSSTTGGGTTVDSETSNPSPSPPSNEIDPKPPSGADPDVTPDNTTDDTTEEGRIVKPKSRFARVFTMMRESSDSTFDTDDFINSMPSGGSSGSPEFTPSTPPPQQPPNPPQPPAAPGNTYTHLQPYVGHFDPGYDTVTGDLVWKVGYGFAGSFDNFEDYVRYLTNPIMKRVQDEMTARPGGNGRRMRPDKDEIIDVAAMLAQKRLYFRSNPGYVYCYWGHATPRMLRLFQAPHYFRNHHCSHLYWYLVCATANSTELKDNTYRILIGRHGFVGRGEELVVISYDSIVIPGNSFFNPMSIEVRDENDELYDLQVPYIVEWTFTPIKAA